MSFGGSMLKEACGRRPLDEKQRQQNNYLNYLDTMQENLNKNIQSNVFPYWRNHNSLKGWTSMNYPAVIENPLLKKLKSKPDLQEKTFSN